MSLELGMWLMIGLAFLISTVGLGLFVTTTRRISRNVATAFDAVSEAVLNLQVIIGSSETQEPHSPTVVHFDAITADRIATIVQTEMTPTYDALRVAGESLGRLMLGGTPDALTAQYEGLVAAGEALYARTHHSNDKRQRAAWVQAVNRWDPRPRTSGPTTG